MIAPGLKNGFPFPIRELAEDGQPFQQWDGSTVAINISAPYERWCERTPYKFSGPSKSATQKITVYGEGSIFCIPLTFAQLTEFYWRTKELSAKFKESGSMVYGVTASAATTGVDEFTVTKTASPSVSTEGVYLEASLTVPYDRTVDIYRGRTAPNQWFNGTRWPWQGGGFLNAGDTVLQSEASLVARYPGSMSNAYSADLFDPVNSKDAQGNVYSDPIYTSGLTGYFGRTSDNGPRHSYASPDGAAGVSAFYYLDGGAKYAWGDNSSRWMGYLPGAHNVIRVAPGEYWYAPLMGGGSGLLQLRARASCEWGFMYPRPIGTTGRTVYSYSSASQSASAEYLAYFVDGDFLTTWTEYKNDDSDGGSWIDPTGAGCFPVELKLSSGTATGTAFGFYANRQATAHDFRPDAPDSTAGTATATVPTTNLAPAVVIEASKWWEYKDLSGTPRWDDGTGTWQGSTV